MKAPLVFCLHGFLGSPSDWQFLMGPNSDLYEFVFVDYTHEAFLDPSQPLISWGQNFNKYAMSFGEDRTRHIIGYSLGGRLALHAIREKPDMWSKAILISTHLGFEQDQQKQARMKTDFMFAEKIEKANWNHVMSDWNKQFQDKGLEPSREDLEKERKTLSTVLKNWSLGFQYNFKENIAAWPVQQMWVAGGADSKYLEILESIPAVANIQKKVVPESSHRVLFEQPEILKQQIEQFLE